jgi:hypothetical protein
LSCISLHIIPVVLALMFWSFLFHASAWAPLVELAVDFLSLSFWSHES